MLIGVESKALAVPGAEGRRIGSAQEVPTNTEHTFHAATLPEQSTVNPAIRHTEEVAVVRWSSTLPRVLIEDVRGNDGFLRVTLHEDTGVIVFSHWVGEMCVAATRIPLSAAGELMELLDAASDSEGG